MFGGCGRKRVRGLFTIQNFKSSTAPSFDDPLWALLKTFFKGIGELYHHANKPSVEHFDHHQVAGPQHERPSATGRSSPPPQGPYDGIETAQILEPRRIILGRPSL